MADYGQFMVEAELIWVAIADDDQFVLGSGSIIVAIIDYGQFMEEIKSI